MKNLIIHPEDTSTDFLKPIYINANNATIINNDINKKQLKQLITEHDRIIMLGHGSPRGLFSYSNSGFIIDDTIVKMLRNKECISIWCNADEFMNKHKLNGFYSGMFISEVNEAYICGLPNTSQETITTSNDYFAKLLGELINEPLDVINEHVKINYELLARSNSIALYNYNRLYLKKYNMRNKKLVRIW